MSRKYKSLINWFGGKGQMLSKLLNFIPEHEKYVEVFGGGGVLLLNKEPAKIEIYNDLNDDLVNLYSVIRDPEKFEEFQRMASFTPYSRQVFSDAKESNPKNDVERAWAFFVRMKMSFSGLGQTWSHAIDTSRRGMSLRVSAWLSTVDGLEEIHTRFRFVQVEKLDFRKCIKKYDSKNTFFYLDPPYVHSTRISGNYDYEMSDDDHKDLIDMILGCEGKFLLSGYENEIYERLEREGWKKICFDVKCNVMNKRNASATKRKEVVWMNYSKPKIDEFFG